MALDMRRLELDDDYMAMFPLDPATCDIPDDVLLREGYYVQLRWHGAHIYNPIRAYERIRGKGSWPKDTDLKPMIRPEESMEANGEDEEKEWLLERALLCEKDLARARKLRKIAHRELNRLARTPESRESILSSGTPEDGILYDREGLGMRDARPLKQF